MFVLQGSNVLRASILTIFVVIIVAALSLFAKGPPRTDSLSVETNTRIASRGVGEKRDFGSEEGSILLNVDPIVVEKAEAEIHTFLNAQRRKHCSDRPAYKESGRVNLATLSSLKGKQQLGLFEVQYGNEVFFARVSMAPTNSQSKAEGSYTVLEMVPGPCQNDAKNQLAVTAQGMLTSVTLFFMLHP